MAASQDQEGFFTRDDLGATYWRAGDKNRAIHYWTAALRTNPHDGIVARNLGVALDVIGLHDAARRVYSDFLNKCPDNTEIGELLSINYALALTAEEVTSSDKTPLLDTLTHEKFADYTYSKARHFSSLIIPYFHKDKHMGYCDLKVYQDMVIFNYLLSNLPRGARILEVGGGDSRIIRALRNYFECWNLDKFEGIGDGPTVKQTFPGTRVVMDYIGGFNKELPDNYFDCVYSISTLEHVPVEQDVFKDITADIKRILRHGGHSVHCIDILITKDGVWAHGLLDYFYNNENIVNPRIEFDDMVADPDIYVMSEKFYNISWLPLTGDSYEDCGKPLSYNILWRK